MIYLGSYHDLDTTVECHAGRGKVAIKRNLWTVSLSSVIHLSCSGYSTSHLAVRVRSSAPLIMEHLLVDDVSPLQKHLHLGRDYRRMDRLG